jgi:hypothetical protein
MFSYLWPMLAQVYRDVFKEFVFFFYDMGALQCSLSWPFPPSYLHFDNRE